MARIMVPLLFVLLFAASEAKAGCSCPSGWKPTLTWVVDHKCKSKTTTAYICCAGYTYSNGKCTASSGGSTSSSGGAGSAPTCGSCPAARAKLGCFQHSGQPIWPVCKAIPYIKIAKSNCPGAVTIIWQGTHCIEGQGTYFGSGASANMWVAHPLK